MKKKTQPHRVEHMLKKKREKNFNHNVRDMTCERRDKMNRKSKKVIEHGNMHLYLVEMYCSKCWCRGDFDVWCGKC